MNTYHHHPALPSTHFLGLSKRELFALAFTLLHGLTPEGGVQRADQLLAALNAPPSSHG